MDVSLAIRQRLDALGLEQRHLAHAAQVTESYISQLLTRRREPPAPDRTDIYEKMERALKLPPGELARLASHQRALRLKQVLGDAPAPLFGEVRELILRKCDRRQAKAVGAIFRQQPFGELERLVTRTIVHVVRRMTKRELENEHWLRMVARQSGRSYREMRVVALEFLDTDILQLSPENCVTFLEPLIEGWTIDLATFAIEISLHARKRRETTRFRFMETAAGSETREPGFVEFLKDPSLSGSATDREIAFLEGLKFTTGRPTALYYYRELQGLRDPLHFRQTN